MNPRVKIHVDINEVKPISPGSNCVTVCLMDGTIVYRGDRVELSGKWILRQYRNPVPCGATVVLYSEDEESTWNIR